MNTKKIIVTDNNAQLTTTQKRNIKQTNSVKTVDNINQVPIIFEEYSKKSQNYFKITYNDTASFGVNETLSKLPVPGKIIKLLMTIVDVLDVDDIDAETVKVKFNNKYTVTLNHCIHKNHIVFSNTFFGNKFSVKVKINKEVNIEKFQDNFKKFTIIINDIYKKLAGLYMKLEIVNEKYKDDGMITEIKFLTSKSTTLSVSNKKSKPLMYVSINNNMNYQNSWMASDLHVEDSIDISNKQKYKDLMSQIIIDIKKWNSKK